MKKLMLCIGSLLFCFLLDGQTPLTASLPEKFKDLKAIIVVDHFPNPVKATRDDKAPDLFYWKHNTSLLSEKEDIIIEEGGAYIFYNQQWNLRATYSPKEFSKLFDIPKKGMQKGQTYTFVDNWRKSAELFGGWAMWYVIGTTEKGERVFGIGRLDTVGELY